MGNKEWKVGQKILCVKTHSEGLVVAGNEYTIEGFSCCPCCGVGCVILEECRIYNGLHCMKCDFKGLQGQRSMYRRTLFIRPDLESLTEYRNQVSVREIPSELKKLEPLQNQ